MGRSQSVRESRGVYEMMPQAAPRQQHGRGSQGGGKGAHPVMVRQRSSSAGEVVASGSRPTAVQLKEGLKRRFGSSKRK